MSDLISRQDAIKAVHEEFDKCLVWDESGERTADEVDRILDSVPSAQPERKTGRWTRISMDKYIRHAQAWYRCSECSAEFIGKYKYCGNCGADMRGEEE